MQKAKGYFLAWYENLQGHDLTYRTKLGEIFVGSKKEMDIWESKLQSAATVLGVKIFIKKREIK